MGTGMHEVSVDRATGLLTTTKIADADLLARVAARLRGDDACALPVPDGYYTARDGEILPRRRER
jgi:hypothetical protein